MYGDFLVENLFDMEFDFVGVVDPFISGSFYEKRLKEMAVPVYETLEAFYKVQPADLMIISTPIHLHKAQCELAVKNGSYVLCEKPTAALLSDVMDMIESAKKYEREIFIGFQLSFADPIIRLKQDILSGKFGKPVFAKTIILWERDFAYYNRGSGWGGKIFNADGVAIYDSILSNATSHYLHNFLYLFGDTMSTATMPISISAECKRANAIESFDSCVIEVKTENIQDILFIASHATNGALDPIFEITFENARVNCDFNKGSHLIATLNDGQVIDYGDPTTELQTYQKLIKVMNWLGDKNEYEKPLCTVETTLPIIKAVNMIFEKGDFTAFDSESVVVDEKRQRVYVKGLYEKLLNRYNQGNGVIS